MNYAFRSSVRRIGFCIFIGLIGSRIAFGLFSSDGFPHSPVQFLAFGFLFVTFFFLAERLYRRAFVDHDPEEPLEFVEKQKDEK